MKNQKKIIYDVYLMNLNGLSVFSGCTGTAYCKAHSGQHALHTGFFSAMHSFSKEAFQESLMKSMDFGNVQLNFKIDYERGLMLILVSPETVKKKIVNDQLNTIMELYLTKYADKVEANVTNDTLFQSLLVELKQLGIIHTEHLKPLNKIQMSFDKVAEKVAKFLKLK
jgi:hypothetical protein